MSSTPESNPAGAYAAARDELISDVAALAERLRRLGDGTDADWSDVRTLNRLQDLVLEASRVARGMRDTGSPS